MKLFLISQDQNTGYGTYDSAVVAAKDETDASLINPSGLWADSSTSWCKDPKDVKVIYLGNAIDGTQWGVICASFNAG